MTEIIKHKQNAKNIIIIPIPFDIKEDINSLKLLTEALGFSNISINISPLEKPSFRNSIYHMLSCDLFIGMRLHSILMAWKLNIPTIGLSYDPKVSNLCRRHNIPVIDLSSSDSINFTLLELENLLSDSTSQKFTITKSTYVTPKMFRNFIDKTTNQRILTLSESIAIGNNYSSIISHYNDIVNSKAYKLISLYYKIANVSKKLFL